MDLIAHIGRDLPEPTEIDINVPNEFLNVSHQHATISWHGINNGKEGIVVIEDHDTSNGTFVNGRRYAKTKLHEDDVVCLGGNSKDDYHLNLKKLFADFKQAELKERTDFSEEFVELKQVSVSYFKEKQKIMKVKGWTQRLVMYGVPTIVSTGLGFLVTEKSLSRLLFMVLGFVLGIIVDFMFSKDEREKMEDLRLKYQPRYRCPKCGYKYNLETQHWKQLEAEGCSNPKKCDAKFKKED
jgi:hypothetical protein